MTFSQITIDGFNVSTDLIAGKHHELIKLGFGAEDSIDAVNVDNPLPVHLPAGNGYTGIVPLIMSRMLDTIGDGLGNKQATGDYSGGVTEFKIVPPSSSVFRIARMLIHISDIGSFDSGAYGNNIALANGIEVQIRDSGGVVVDLTDDHQVMTNADWAHFCHDLTIHNFGTGAEHLTARWSFDKSGTPIRLSGIDGEYFTVRVNDDFQGLEKHHFVVQGYDEIVFT